MNPKITIVIPTRDREEYLPSSVQSCLDCNYEHLEVLICDNSSTDNTLDVFHSFADSRLKYVKAPTYLSMVANWEFALTQIQNGYVSFIGDDDAFIAQGIDRVVELIRKHQVKALSWRYGSYRWPGNEFAKMNEVYELPLGNGYEHRDPANYIQSVLDAKLHPNNLPCIYHGLVHMDIIEQVKSTGNGKFFNSRIPDYYALMVLSLFVKDYIYSYEPITIAGSSSKSNGNTQVKIEKNFEIARAEFLKGEGDIEFHSKLRFVHVYSNLIWESWLQANDIFQSRILGVIESSLQLERIVKETVVFNIFNYEKEKISEIAKNFNLPQVPDPNRFLKILYKLQYHFKHYLFFWSTSLFVDCRKEKITNVLESSRQHFVLRKNYGSLFRFPIYNITTLFNRLEIKKLFG
ncbi:MAG: glycosyltransferase family 2 protein [Saprospiraceae bacterium]|nr:glycosyltransferase family 2 protein [Saprospiraceae bacterium]